MGIKENLRLVRGKIAAAAERAGRDPAEIELVAVIKGVPLGKVFAALEEGVMAVGENRVQEAAARAAEIKARFPHVTSHLIGHLQRNKVRQALDLFAIIQSLDSPRLALEISRRALRPVPVLIEVNTSGEASKHGVSPAEALDLVKFVAAQPNLQVEGLMTIGPLSGGLLAARESFRRLRYIRDELNKLALPGVGRQKLSMGMSGDYEEAIAQGADLVRLGRAIFEAPPQF